METPSQKPFTAAVAEAALVHELAPDRPPTVVLLNFGGPASAAAVQPFLNRLFEDPFIIRAPLPLSMRRWLARRIATKRTAKAAEEYAAIGYSPINRFTEIQARHLEAALQAQRPGAKVLVCNRYTAPSASEVVAQLDLQKERLFLITLYPHLCHSTTVSSLRDFDLALRSLPGGRHLPSTRVFSWWFHPRFLAHGTQRILDRLRSLLSSGSEPITVLFSAHGIPTRYDERGDPYVTETRGHVAALRERVSSALGGSGDRVQWRLSFQSRVGPVEWVRPYTDESIAELGRSHGGTLLMVPISFTSDHIETLWEMDRTYRDLALASGFTRFDRVVPANDDPELAACLAEVLLQHGL